MVMALHRKMKREVSVLRVFEAKCNEFFTESRIPSTKGLLETIQCFVEPTHMIWVLWMDVALWLAHVNYF